MENSKYFSLSNQSFACGSAIVFGAVLSWMHGLIQDTLFPTGMWARDNFIIYYDEPLLAELLVNFIFHSGSFGVTSFCLFFLVRNSKVLRCVKLSSVILLVAVTMSYGLALKAAFLVPQDIIIPNLSLIVSSSAIAAVAAFYLARHFVLRIGDVLER